MMIHLCTESVIEHAFTVHHAEKDDIFWAFFNVLGGQINYFSLKGGHVL